MLAHAVMLSFCTLLLLLCGGLEQILAQDNNGSVIEPRIVGGTKAKEGQFPHQISLRLREEHYCGGVIISATHVITAAHCVKHGNDVVPADLWTIQAGSLLLSSGGVRVPVASITVHPDYRPHGHYDLAVLRLQSPLTFDSNIAAIPMATEDPPAGASMDISGWGQTSDKGPLSDSLLFVQVTSMSRETCRWYVQNLPDSMICLLHPRNKGTCFGDSGGPATYNGKVVGLAVLLYGGCGRAAPDGYLRISKLRTWIAEKAGMQ
ncbi:serine protease SP24D [Drosophila eugracilis]|uniref:serine protease SP24D n=1 Tax=Drosophila eugracilis TaxID=29029 RepID=UPI0007E7DFC4|nr:serine protease SP24D [Drosophila eugracilis]